MKILARLMRNLTFRFFWPVVLVLVMSVPAVTLADVPGRTPPRGTVPNPGVQQQELPNITFPAPYNIFEFVVTCIACHGGTIDQSAGHGGNWAGTNMASATRDPVFRANQLIVNNTIKNQTGADGAGNLCFRCHSPNGWLSGRMDPTLGSAADGTDIIHSIVLSTDDEGVSCEQCHRATGAVTMQRSDLDPADPAWNMMAGPVGEWPHAGSPYHAGPWADNPYGDATLQYHDGMSYGGRYGGNTEISFSDVPYFNDFPSSGYTGQTYGIYPWWYTGIVTPAPIGMPSTNILNEVLAWNLDGSLSFQFEAGVMPDPLWGAISPEHSTRANDFIMSPEFCGSCHDVTVPMANSGMPEQRTYTEWKYSAYGNGTSGLPDARCQGCHMPTKKHEYSDDAPVSVNPDPVLSGWYPYAKDRNIGGGTAFHKFAGANSVLPKMMKVLYPEIDLEVIGAPTGHDPMIFPGMLSDRGPMFDRAIRNTEISLRDAASVEITQVPTETSSGVYQVKVKVTNKAGHKIPSGYPDGRRMWLSLVVDDGTGTPVYQSGYYDEAEAKLYTDTSKAGLDRALTPNIDASTGSNAVMIYEKKTGTANGDGTYTMSFSLLNTTVLFDNRIPPLGYDYAQAGPIGGAFWTYDPTTLAPVEDPTRYPDDAASGGRQNWDEVTYTFTAPPGLALTARAELYHQAIPREFMEHLNDSLNDLPVADQGPRPEGPPNILDPNYPLTPTYLSDSIAATTGADFAAMTDLNNVPLRDHWGGVAYAAWLETGKGAPFVLAADDTAVAAPPAAPANVVVTQPINAGTGVTDPNAQTVSWDAVAGADGYLVWVRYGASELTSDWDKLAMTADLELTTVALNPGKTFAYKVQAFNAKGLGGESPVTTAQTAAGQPLPPINLKVTGVTADTISLAWYDQADNETQFEIQRQDVPVDPTAPFPAFATVAVIDSQTAGGFGGNAWTDTGLLSGRTYNYQVRALNAFGPSAWTVPAVSGTTVGPPTAPTNLAATVVNALQVNLAWTDTSGNETGFRIERSTDGGATYAPTGTVGANVTAFSDTTIANTAYSYQVVAYNAIGDSPPSNIVTVTTPAQPPAAPTNLSATASDPAPTPPTVTLAWTYDSTDIVTGFAIERALGAGAFVEIATVAVNETTFLDTTVEPKMTYNYRIRAFNGTLFSLYSNVATAVTPGEIPQAPSNLVVTKVTKNSASLAWVDNADNELGFYIERALSTAPGTWSRVGTVGANTTKYSDKGLASKTSYLYRVQAYNADGVSEFTNTAPATTK